MYVWDLLVLSLCETLQHGIYSQVASALYLLSSLLDYGIFFSASIHLIATIRKIHRLQCPTSAMATTSPKIIF